MAKRIRISVVIATVGRDTLKRTIESAHWADEKIIIFNEWGGWGARAKNLGASWASGTHLCFMDDDDAYTKNAGRIIRRAVKAEPDRIHVFSMSTVEASCLDLGYVGLPMFVVPNIFGRLGKFPDGDYCNDFFFINETAHLQGSPIYHPEECIALIRPEDE